MGLPRSPKCALRGGYTRDQVKCVVRSRDGGRCTGCGVSDAEHLAKTGKRCEVHRKVPGSLYTVDGCVLLCRECHGSQPKRRRGTRDEEGSQVAVRLDPELRERVARLLAAVSAAIGLKVSQSDLFRLGMIELERRYLPEEQAKKRGGK